LSDISILLDLVLAAMAIAIIWRGDFNISANRRLTAVRARILASLLLIGIAVGYLGGFFRTVSTLTMVAILVLAYVLSEKFEPQEPKK